MDNLNSLKVLSVSTQRVIRSIVNTASDNLIRQISELALNCLHNTTVTFTAKDKRYWRKYFKDLKLLADKDISLKNKHRRLKK